MFEEAEDFEPTFNWALEEEKIRPNRGDQISSFYLIFGSFLILSICVLILYYFRKGEKTLTPLQMLQDSTNFLEEDFTEVGENEVEENDVEEE